MGLAAQREFLAESGLPLGTANGIDKSGQKYPGARVFSVLHDLVPRVLMIALRALVATTREVSPALASVAPLNARNEAAGLRLLRDKCLAQLSGSYSNGEGVDEAAITQGLACSKTCSTILLPRTSFPTDHMRLTSLEH